MLIRRKAKPIPMIQLMGRVVKEVIPSTASRSILRSVYFDDPAVRSRITSFTVVERKPSCGIKPLRYKLRSGYCAKASSA